LALSLLIVSTQAKAELLKNFKFDGSVEMDATSANNVLDFNSKAADRIGAAQTRVMLGMDWDLLEDVHSKVSLYKNDQVYGQYNGVGNADLSGAQNLNNIESNVFVSQAYFKVDKVFGFVDSTFGRQYYGAPGDLIAYYGPKYGQYGMGVTSIDGARFDWNGEHAYATGLAFRPSNAVNAIGNSGTALTGQQDIRALMLGCKGNENGDGKISLWNRETHFTQGAAAAANDNLYIADVKIKGKAAGAYGSLEVGYNFGENRAAVAAPNQYSGRYDGKAILADLGYKADIEQVATINPWAQFGLGTGNGTTNVTSHNEDFQSIATDYRPGAIYGRFDDTAALQFGNNPNGVVSSNGLTNRRIFGAGVKATPAALSKLTVGAAFWDINLDKLVDESFFHGPPPDAYGNRHIGSEVDLSAEWKHSENVSLVGTLGDFQPGGFIKNLNGSQGRGNNPATMAAFDVTVKF
jgi:hypothetical protein